MSAAFERFLAAVEAKTGHRRVRSGDGFKLFCPSHDGHTPALSATETPDGHILLHCHFGCDSDAILRSLGLEWRDLLDDEPKPLQAARQEGPAAASTEAATQSSAPQTLAEFCKQRRLDPERLASRWQAKETASQGRPCLRYPTAIKIDRLKFLDGAKPKYRWAAKGGHAHLYGLGAARKHGGQVLYLVNGEPSVWAADQAGVAAVCLCGEGVAFSPPMIEDLKSSGFPRFALIYDRDAAGRDGARKAIKALRGAGLEAQALELPADLGAGADVDDLHRRVGDDGLLAALEELPELEAEPEPAPQADPLEQLDALPEGASLPAIEQALRAFTRAAATLDPLALETAREAALRRLKALGISSPGRMLEAALPAAPKAADGAQGTACVLADPAPWPEPVDGADLADDLVGFFKKYIVFPDGAAEALALWAIMAHAEAAFDILPLLALTSPEMQCGKSTALALLGAVVPRPLPSANISPAALFRAVEKYRPTLLLDEAETYMRDGNEALRGILNAGHARTQAFVMRVEGDSLEPRIFSTWGPKVFALIGRLPATLEDRSIVIPMKRKAKGERVERLRLDRLPAEGEPLRQRAARWAADNIGTLKNADPPVPAELVRDRTRDNWRPLLAIADLLGGAWPNEARRAALALAGGRPTEDTARITLLEDIRAIFKEEGVDRLPSGDLVKSLVELEDHPWPEWRDGRSLTATQLARLLKPFGIAPVKWRGEGEQRTWRGYQVADFLDSFNRYLEDGNAPPPAETPPFKPPQPPQARKQEVSAGNATATEHYFVADGKNANSLEMRRVADVAAQPGGVSRAPLDEDFLEV